MKSDVYLLSEATTGIGRGGYPQIQKMTEGYDYNSFNSVHKLLPDKFPDFEPDFDYPTVRDGSILTDLISHAPIPHFVLIVTSKLLDVFSKFNLPPNQVYPISVMHKGQKVEGVYSAFHILNPEDHLNYIDYKKSKFWIRDIISKNNAEALSLSSRDDLDRAFSDARGKEITSQVWAEELVMQDEFYNLFDLFSLSSITFPVTFKVTEKLKEAIEAEGCTGIAFQNLSTNKEDLKDFLSKKVITTFFPC